MNAKRDFNIELLRMICMLLVVSSHCILHGDNNSGILLNPEYFTFNHFFCILVGTWGRLAVEVFVFISAYYMVDKTNGFRSKKVIKIGLQTWIYCIIITGIIYGFHLRPFSATDIIKEIMTPAFPQYWFITNYILFYMLVPFLQNLVGNLTIRQLRCLVICLTGIIMCIRVAESVSNLVYFGYLFIVAALLKRDEDWFDNHRKIIAGISFIFNILLKLVVYDSDLLIGHELSNGILNILQMLLGSVTSILAISLFFIFKSLKSQHLTGMVKRFSMTTLGVYIIHENLLLRGATGQSALIWDDIFGIGNAFYVSKMFPVKVILSVVMVYIICVLIDSVRIEIMDKRIIDNIGWLNRVCKKVDTYFVNMEDKNSK